MVQGSISWTQLYPRSGRFRFQYQEPYSLLYQVGLGFNVIISLFNSSGTDFFTLDDTDTKQFANLGCFGLYDKYGSLCLLYKYKLCLSVGLFPIKDDKFWQKTCRNLLFLKMHQFNQKKPRKFKTQSVPGEVKFTIMRPYLEAKFKEFKPRLKLEPRLKYGWFHWKLYSILQDLSRRSIKTSFFKFKTRHSLN